MIHLLRILNKCSVYVIPPLLQPQPFARLVEDVLEDGKDAGVVDAVVVEVRIGPEAGGIGEKAFENLAVVHLPRGLHLGPFFLPAGKGGEKGAHRLEDSHAVG